MSGLAIGLAALAATGAPCPPASVPAPPPNRPAYALVVHVHRDLRGADGTEAIGFRPAVATDRVVLRLWANGPAFAREGARLTVRGVTSGGRALPTSRPGPTTLVVRRRLAAGERIAMRLRWALVLPRGDGARMHGGGTVRLASFFPLLAWDGDSWRTDPPAAVDIGETWTSPAADFDVRVTHPAGLRVLATGSRVARDRWHARAVRDFALALGRFRIASTTVRLPGPVHVVVGVEPGRGARPASTYLALAVEALRAHSKRFGAYPWSSYSVAVMPDFEDPVGIEYPGLVFIGAGSDFVIGHETGHQWFYSLVGNDQGRDPWLDEGLASWADVRAGGFQSGYLHETIPPEDANRLGEPMSFWVGLGGRAIHFGVYVQGVQALAALGTPEEVDCALRAYVTANAYRTATPDDLLAALLPFFPDARAQLAARGVRFQFSRLSS